MACVEFAARAASVPSGGCPAPKSQLSPAGAATQASRGPDAARKGSRGTTGCKSFAQEIITPRKVSDLTVNTPTDTPWALSAASKLQANTPYGSSFERASCGGAVSDDAPAFVDRPHAPSGHFAEDCESDLSPTSSRGCPDGMPKPRFDILTLRQWFNVMDTDHNGHVSKMEWYEFLRNNPKLKYFILHGNVQMPPPGYRDRATDETAQIQRAETKEMRRLVKIWREIDADGNGTLEWDEFIEFFRRNGNLLEYETQDHPKARLTNILCEMHDKPDNVNEATLEEFERLTKANVHGNRRRSLEMEALTNCSPQSPTAVRIHRRHSASCVPEPA